MTRHFPKRPLLLALSLTYAAHAAATPAATPAGMAEAAENASAVDTAEVRHSDSVMPVVTVTGAAVATDDYTARSSKSASRLDLSLRETPQSVSVVTRALMDDFQLTTINDVLGATTGVTVEKVETSRTYFTSRGFDIVNFQYDGVGLPQVFGNLQGDIDTALYDRIDIVRGANGLMTSTGNPSATVNFVRKRPTAQTAASASVTLGSWNTRRVEGDVTSKLNESGSVTGRAVLVHQDGDSYLDRYQPKRDIAYAVVDARLGDATELTVGHTYEAGRNKGVMWGALPLYYTDGTATSYPRSTNTAADWSRWDTTNNSTFAELRHQLGQGWQVLATANYLTEKSDSTLQYVYGTPDRTTGLGLLAYPSKYASSHTQSLVDVAVDGKFALGGRAHDLSFGYNWSKSRLTDQSLYGRGIGDSLPGNTAFDGSFPLPLFDASTDGSRYQDRRSSVFAATRLNLADDWKLLAGLNHTRARGDGFSYGASRARSATRTTPYVGVVYDINPSLSAYASHTQIFNPQTETDASGATLAPIEGRTTEAGLKSALFDGRLNLSGAVFNTRQDNTAETAGFVGGKTIYRAINAESQGVELEASGQLARGWQASAGVTSLAIHGDRGEQAKPYIPRTSVRANTTYTVAGLPALKVGGSLRWQSKSSVDQGAGITTTQSSYAVLGLMARYAFDRHLSLAINLNNVTDKKYLTSLYWTQSYYAAPRNGSATLTWTY
ncbi:TonB-dependent receptor [Duganella sp. Leaf126]|uniref:TonB-dependent siderophore receptor n=1 Tax=Duganella sp. Leaf126 TaxID=1736266 RepID=UPI0006F437BA|nr:TonB-dependent siderophore receptor [Duganella sp. Leaf126]KQQ36227.1 TonB-dependent receptor [Duganella sp. Leaf126]